ncbi:unnamed protein product [Amoebophrya sp. A120]|nr:unnamed protein product [Amoebophrya sp. A120]|eukprot:GSA120T00002406001.1
MATLASYAPLLTASGFYVGSSIGLISFNKYLVNESRFPFAVALVLLHMSVSFLCALLFYFIRPDLYPNAEYLRKEYLFPASYAKTGKVSAAAQAYVQRILWTMLPISLFFAGTLVLSNMAYLYCSMAFLQMMKEGNLALVYIGSLLLGLEKSIETRILGILCFIIGATSMTIYGEMHFVLVGFLIQLGSQACEVSKILLQNKCLSQAAQQEDQENEGEIQLDDEEKGLAGTAASSEEDRGVVKAGTSSKAGANSPPPKLDPLSFVLFCSPCCVPILLVKLYVLEYDARILTQGAIYALPLLANAVLAFGLNVSIACFMQHASAVSFLVCGVAKDVLIVFLGMLLFQEPVTPLQLTFFGLQIYGITLYSCVRGFPTQFRDDEWAAWTLTKKLLCIEPWDTDAETLKRVETQPLTESTAATSSSSSYTTDQEDPRQLSPRSNGDSIGHVK